MIRGRLPAAADPYAEELTVMDTTIREAGARALQLARDGFETMTKADHSPVTTADLEVNRILHTALLTAFPEDGWLSEETADRPDRSTKRRVWILDPIDGTKYFMRGIPTYAISLALAVGQELRLGVVFNPATDEYFLAVRGAGAWLNGEPIRVKQAVSEPPHVLVNPPAFDKGRFSYLDGRARCQPLGSIAYTLAWLAAGRADGTINKAPLHEWDIAAGALLVEEAGGLLTDGNGQPLQFNQLDSSLTGVIAASLVALPHVRALLTVPD
jgi:myo-inositol-1(or 4)-monophosphatase